MTVEVGYAEITAPVTVNALTSAGSTTVVTLPPIAFPGGIDYWVEFSMPSFSHNTASVNLYIELWDGSSGFQRLWDGRVRAAAQPDIGGVFRARYTPAAGTRTLSIRAHVDTTAGGVIGAGAGTIGQDMPAYVRIEAIDGAQEAVAPVAVTAPVSVTATTEATAQTIATLGAITLTGLTTVMLEWFIPWWGSTTTTAINSFWLYQGAASIGRLGTGRATVANVQHEGLTLRRRLTLGAGTYTFSLRASTSSGTLTVTGGVAGSGSNDVPILGRALVESGGLLQEVQKSYTDVQVNTDCTATSEATATTVVTAPALTVDGLTPVRLLVAFNSYGMSGTSQTFRLIAHNGTAVIGTINTGKDYLGVSSSRGGGVYEFRFTPAAGTWTFSIRGFVSAAGTYKLAGDIVGNVDRDSPFALSVATLIDPAALGVVTTGDERQSRRRRWTSLFKK